MKPVGFDAEGGKHRQGDRGENAGQGFWKGFGSAGAWAWRHECSPGGKRTAL